MRWFKDPPCIPMKVSLHDVQAGRLELDESGLNRLWNAGLFTTVGTFMAGVGLKVARWTPGLMKLVPLGVATAGGASAALGVMTGLAHLNISVERGRGVRLRWRFGRGRPRELRVPQDKIAAFEVVHRKRTKKESEIELEESFYLLMLVDTDGKATPLEEFGTRTQAKLRQQMIAQVLGSDDAAVDAKVEPQVSAKDDDKEATAAAPQVTPDVKPARKKAPVRSKATAKDKPTRPRPKKTTRR
jgi:hypothetical protein